MNTLQHHSPRAAQKLAFMRKGEKMHELCLKRSDVRLDVNINAEIAAREAAAKLCGKTGRHISEVWTEDGESPDLGKYRIWYLVTVPVGNS
jgi:hypothetical protein